jgi:hypothetical protein
MQQQFVTVAGRQPVNPIGQCFDSAAWVFVKWPGISKRPDIRLCHGIGVANLPGQEGMTIAHAWIEFDDAKHGRCALDTAWMIAVTAAKYRADLQVSFSLEYGFDEFIKLWQELGYPGPYQDRIYELTKEGRKGIPKCHSGL